VNQQGGHCRISRIALPLTQCHSFSTHLLMCTSRTLPATPPDRLLSSSPLWVCLGMQKLHSANMMVIGWECSRLQRTRVSMKQLSARCILETSRQLDGSTVATGFVCQVLWYGAGSDCFSYELMQAVDRAPTSLAFHPCTLFALCATRHHAPREAPRRGDPEVIAN